MHVGASVLVPPRGEGEKSVRVAMGMVAEMDGGNRGRSRSNVVFLDPTLEKEK